VPGQQQPVLVTGATGNVGRHLVTQLMQTGRAVRAAHRAGTPPAAVPEGAQVVTFDYTRPATWGPAFAGVSVMFVVRPPHLGAVRRDMVPALEAARAAGVDHMVLLSLQGVGRNPVLPHARLEKWLRHSGIGWTFVQPSFFMENLSTIHAGDIRDRDELMVPAGDGRTAFVAARDVAAVAAAAVSDPAAHRGRAWTPTGPTALTYQAVAEILTEVLGRPIGYRRPGPLAYARHARRALGMPWPMVGVTTVIYGTARLGLAAGLTTDVERVTGRPPASFQDWAAEHAGTWRAGD
jgi:uncharacterized protein YbjT (DUF2867 family)